MGKNPSSNLPFFSYRRWIASLSARNDAADSVSLVSSYGVIGASLLAITACDLSPDFSLPDVAKPAAFKEDIAVETPSIEPATDGRWKRFDEKAQIEEFGWWRMFNDITLDGLMEQAMKDNPTLDAAIERVNSARAVAESSDAALLPKMGIGAGPSRQLQSPASIKPNLPAGSIATTKPYTLYDAKGTISYELDLFGQNRAKARAETHKAQAQANDYRAVRLALQAEVAQTYFRVIALRSENDILTRSLKTREEALKVTKSKYDAGEIDSLALSSIEADQANVKADAASVAQLLALQEHALAVLVGQPPSVLKLETFDLRESLPIVPAGIPSALLERRPDIKQAEELMAAANEKIGVARSGYFPDISLSATGGFTSGALSNLFDWSNRTWMIGPLVGTMLTQPIFEGGKVAAYKAQTKADFAASVADYKAAVLQAFREVEDQLSGLRYAADQAKAVDDALAASKRSYHVANERYKVGYSSYLEYLDAKRSLLSAERSKVQVMANRYVTTVQLVRALGGSWQAPSVPEATAPMEVPPDAKPAKETSPKPESEFSGTWYDPIVDLLP